jgi:hypothetical protein
LIEDFNLWPFDAERLLPEHDPEPVFRKDHAPLKKHDPEKWEPVFRKDHAPLKKHDPEKWEPVFRKCMPLGLTEGSCSAKRWSGMTIGRKVIPLWPHRGTRVGNLGA